MCKRRIEINGKVEILILSYGLHVVLTVRIRTETQNNNI
jgi:hypothetical protein